MKNKNPINKKEELLQEIEALLSYKPEEKTTINPNYLEYLELEDLESIKKGLINKIGKLSQEDIVWLEQFKKYD
ncbi:MAG: Unknown protein [uncultured Sulfurovum sp.]|uniref:Uncharacterized protein n=1 Tax=uncultured Sulfurovum sp. TaxID=269237 RepID=A0A6S6S6Z8_9BACT|nr:MAG: Unknown protein [uncultured Sulfurovum sp.]